MTRRRLRGLLVVLVVSVSMLGCGDGGRTADAPDDPSPSASASRIPLPSPDPAAVAAIRDGVLTPADLGSEWGEFRAATGVLRDIGLGTRVGCALEPQGSVDPAGLEAVVDGPISQRGSTTHYASSAALRFQDEAAGQAAIEAFRSERWSTCREAKKTEEEQAQAGASENRWTADPVDDQGRGQGGLEGIIRFQFQAVVDGELVDANGYETVLIYRMGSTVLIVAAEGVRADSDPPDLDERRDRELQTATAAALDRLG